MKEKNNSRENDIIKRIVDQLKQADELPYEEGAWERFRDVHLPKTKAKRIIPIWTSAAAACILLCMAGFWYFSSDSTNVADVAESTWSSTNTEAQPQTQTEILAPGNTSILPEIDESQRTSVSKFVAHVANRMTLLSGVDVFRSWVSDAPNPVLLSASVVDISNAMELNKSSLIFLEDEDNKHSVESVGGLPSVFSSSNGVRTVAMKEVVGENKRFRFSDKFNVGVMVSPSSTDQKTNFGGGLMLSYHVTKNLSVRTGASFNQYEVGALRNPAQAASMEIAVAPDRPLQADMPVFSSNMSARIPLIPNVNSISGMVRTIDVPVEAKYSFYKGVYAGVGISYAAVLNQQRFAHYIENINANPYSGGLPSNEEELRAAVQPVMQTMESANNNVNTSGFGGFVNMSVGKEIKLKRGPSVSLEPYVKLPVGNFKRADMNYTNGGIRVITNF